MKRINQNGDVEVYETNLDIIGEDFWEGVGKYILEERLPKISKIIEPT